jgi:hypothetical protein
LIYQILLTYTLSFIYPTQSQNVLPNSPHKKSLASPTITTLNAIFGERENMEEEDFEMSVEEDYSPFFPQGLAAGLAHLPPPFSTRIPLTTPSNCRTFPPLPSPLIN